MSAVNCRLALAVVLIAPGPLLAQDSAPSTEALNPVVVTASPISQPLDESLQSVTVITREEIERLPVTTLAELLSSVGGVDVRRRGGPGVQADIGIRGTAYEQTLLLVNGVPLRDPQTGHHDMNIPVALELIERIEVIKGPGGVIYGGSATGGLINIITRTPVGTEWGVEARSGTHATRQAGVHAGAVAGQTGHLFSASRYKSDGHLPERQSDADLRQFSYTGSATLERGSLTWGLGAEDKSFGAWKFYTANFPDQREEVTSHLAYVSGQFEAGGWTMTPRVYWRGHDDWFRTRVGATDYINEHETDIRGFSLGARTAWRQGVSAVGVAGARERIESNALNDHRRSETTLWAAHRQQLGQRAALEASLGYVDYSDYGDELLPAIGFRYRLAPGLTGFASTARSVRIPSYTEQFLLTSGNRGNPALEPERSRYHEAGLRFAEGGHGYSAAVFERRTRDLIDWARHPGEVAWQADNFDGHRTRGAELEWRWRPPVIDRLDQLRLSWTLLNTRLDDGGREIKYALDYPRQAWSATGLFHLGSGLGLSLQARYVDRRSGDSATLVAARLVRTFEVLQLFVEGANLLDREIIETGFAPIPGRTFQFGVRAQF